jgi:hypothetical protein
MAFKWKRWSSSSGTGVLYRVRHTSFSERWLLDIAAVGLVFLVDGYPLSLRGEEKGIGDEEGEEVTRIDRVQV